MKGVVVKTDPLGISRANDDLETIKTTTINKNKKNIGLLHPGIMLGIGIINIEKGL